LWILSSGTVLEFGTSFVLWHSQHWSGSDSGRHVAPLKNERPLW
jgi:hypothetical protein